MMTRLLQPRRSLRTDARLAIAECAGWNGRHAARRITQFLEDRMLGSPVGLAQFWLMSQIASAEDDSLGALAARMGLDQSSLSRNLQVLERDELVEIALVEGDRRRRMVWLTEKGARALEEAIPIWRKAHAALAERVPADAAAMFVRVAALLDGD
jgi:DNA-binding MarR family transcriptional regulator